MNMICPISLLPLTGKERRPGYNSTAYQKLFEKLANPELSFSRQEFFIESPKAVQGMSISGVQQKLGLCVENGQLVICAIGGEFILKPSPETFAHAAENEHTAMKVSALLGINTAECGLLKFRDSDEYAYITRRFDRDDGVRLPQEDLLACLDLGPDQKYEPTYEAAGRCLYQACGGKAAPVLDYLRRVVFSYLIGNNDLHMKNVSLYKSSSAKTAYDKLTPNYDALFCRIYDGLNSEMSNPLLSENGSITEEELSANYERYGFYTGYDFVLLAQRLNIPATMVIKFIQKIESQADNIFALIERSFLPEDMKTQCQTLVAERMKNLLLLDAVS